MKKIMTLIALMSLISTQTFAIDKCAILKSRVSKLQTKKESLQMMNDLQAEKTQAQEIKDLLIDNQDTREIMRLAEALEEEKQSISEGQVTNGKYAGVASLGAIMIAANVMTKLKQTEAGLSLRQRLVAYLKSNNKRMVRNIMHGAFVLSIVATVYMGYQIYKGQEQKNILVDLINQLNSIRDLTNEIEKLQEEIEEDEVFIYMKKEELVNDGIIEIKDNLIRCIES